MRSRFVAPLLAGGLLPCLVAKATAQCSNTGMLPMPHLVVQYGDQPCGTGASGTFWGIVVRTATCPQFLVEIPAHDGVTARRGFDAVPLRLVPVHGIPFTCAAADLLIVPAQACTPLPQVVVGAVVDHGNRPCPGVIPAAGGAAAVGDP